MMITTTTRMGHDSEPMSDADADEGGENDDDHDDNDDDTNDDDDDDADDDEEDAEVGNPNPGWPPEAAGFCGIFGRYSPPFSQGVRHERARRSRRPGGHGFRPCCNCSHSRPRHFEAEFYAGRNREMQALRIEQTDNPFALLTSH